MPECDRSIEHSEGNDRKFTECMNKLVLESETFCMEKGTERKGAAFFLLASPLHFSGAVFCSSVGLSSCTSGLL